MASRGTSPEVSTGVKQAGIKLIVYKETKLGDLRKFQARSNDSDTGGGARDLRFRPDSSFGPVFRRLFPRTEQRKTTRHGQRVDIDVFVGRVNWMQGDKRTSREAEYWPETPSRPQEGRWSRVYEFWPFQQTIREDEGHIVTLLVQDDNDDVWLYICTEDELRDESWNQAVIDIIFDCIGSKRRESQSAAGYIDFARGRRFCNAS